MVLQRQGRVNATLVPMDGPLLIALLSIVPVARSLISVVAKYAAGRRSDVRITVKSGGHRIQLDASKVNDAEALLRVVLDKSHNDGDTE